MMSETSTNDQVLANRLLNEVRKELAAKRAELTRVGETYIELKRQQQELLDGLRVLKTSDSDYAQAVAPNRANEPAATSPEQPTAPGETVVTRAERILSGDIRPDDYLNVPPEVISWVDQHLAQFGTVPPQTRQWMIDNNTLHHYFPDREVICWRTGKGVVVLAHGAEVDAVLNALTPEQRSKVTTEYP